MKNKPTVTIGIPAYNEEANIGRLLSALLKQKQENFILEKIIVVSDESTDKTEEIVKAIKDKRIELLRNRKRLGKSLSQNIIVKKLVSDYLVIFDADILPKTSGVLENILKPFIKNPKVGLVGGKVEAIKQTTLFENVLNYSSHMKNEIYMALNSGNNIYNCHGRIRAFSKKFAKSMKWQSVAGEDAFSYLSCISKGYQFQYEPTAKVIYKLPNNLNDHLRQSVRFHSTKKHLEFFFGKELVVSSYKIPPKLQFRVLLRNTKQDFRLTTLYLFLLLYSRVLSLVGDESKSKWKISTSSKNLILNK
ncbi:glycosyltransferase family 2 protein [Candidatus Woesebacteria bacterium]|nr:MAG: glycosyltransferase family 2 protein [Candidatus Woesebacteria bacterium]